MTPCRHITALRTATVFAVVAALLTLPACAREDPVHPQPTRPEPTIHSLDAKRSVVDLVDASAEALGGEWEVLDRVHQGVCSDSTYTQSYGITWRYRLRLVTGDPSGAERDIPILEALWREHGLSVSRTKSGGAHPDLGIVGRGDVVRSIGYLDSEFGGITIGGESPCALDDAPDHGADDDVPPTTTPPHEPASDAAGPAASG